MNFVLTSALEFLGPFDGQSGRRFGVSAISKGKKYGLQIITSHLTELHIHVDIFGLDEIPFVFAKITCILQFLCILFNES